MQRLPRTVTTRFVLGASPPPTSRSTTPFNRSTTRTAALAAALFALGQGTLAWAALPIGYVDKTSDNEVVGWARDPDIAGGIAVHIYVDDVLQAGVVANLDFEYIRPDAFAGGHGFYWRHDPFGPGTHHIDAYAIDVDSGGALTGQNPPLVFNAPATFGPFLFGYYWASAPQAYGDFTAELASFTNLMLVHTSGGEDQAYYDRVNLSGSKLILDLSYCMWQCHNHTDPNCLPFDDVQLAAHWDWCYQGWYSKFRPQNVYGYYLADEPGIGDPIAHAAVERLARLVKQKTGKRTIISGHAGTWGPYLAGIDLDVFTVSLGCYWSGVQGCRDNYALLPQSFSSGQLLTVGAYHSPREYSNFTAGEQQPFMAWGRSDPRFNGILVFLYPTVGDMQGVRDNPEILAYHRAIGHEILCANTTENDTVCGANGVTYANADQAKCAGTTIARYGDCCTNECSRGQTRCLGNEPQSCVAEGACWIWPRQHGAGCTASCVDMGTRCNGEAVFHLRSCTGGTCQDGQCTTTATEEAWSTTMCNDAVEGTLGTTCVGGECVPIPPVAVPDASPVAIPDASPVAVPDAGAVAVPDAAAVAVPDAGAGADADTTTVVANNPQPTSTPSGAGPGAGQDAGGLPETAPSTPQELQLGHGFACSSGGDPSASALLLALFVLVAVFRRPLRRLPRSALHASARFLF